MIALDDALRGVTKLCFDTAPVIYFIEAHPKYDGLVTEIFQRLAPHTFNGITSVITLCEVLVHPFLHNHTSLQREYRDLLLNSANFQTIQIDANTAERAAELRANYKLRTPDALQIAIALNNGCEAFLTNDADMRRVTELRILVLDELQLTSESNPVP
jgi:predicted nucleic acid-binding protein